MSSNNKPDAVFPPRWADRALRVLLGQDDGETSSGDLLEEYREVVYPSRGRWRADLWFTGQIAGFAWRATWIWALLLTALLLGRDALDWFLPPIDFKMRSIITTYSVLCIFATLGCWRAWHTRSLRASVMAAGITTATAAALKTIGVVIMFAIWHDVETRFAIARSGGLSESFELPWLAILPGTVLAAAGGVIGKTAAWLLQGTPISPPK